MKANHLKKKNKTSKETKNIQYRISKDKHFRTNRFKKVHNVNKMKE